MKVHTSFSELICPLDSYAIDKYNLVQSKELDNLLVYGNPKLTEYFPTIKFSTKNANTIICDANTNPPYKLITLDDAKKILNESQSKTTAKILYDAVKDKGDLYLASNYFPLYDSTTYKSIETKFDKMFIKHDNDIKNICYLTELKYYVNKGRISIEENYKKIEKMLQSKDPSDIAFAIRILETVDIYKSCYRFFYIMCKYWFIIDKNKSPRLKKILDLIGFSIKKLCNPLTFYSSYMNTIRNIDFNKVAEIQAELLC